MSYTTLYCSSDDVASVLSGEGVDFSVDDNRDGSTNADESNFVNDVMEHCQSKINFYLSPRYDLSTIPGNTWVKWCMAVLSAAQLLRRRGETPPRGLEEQEEQYLFWLEEIRNVKALVPADGESDARLVASSAGMSMSNLKVDHRFRVAKIRYVPRISTKPYGAPGGIPRYPDNGALTMQ